MNKISLLAGPALLLALFVTGCETDAISARVQEKSGVYATLKPWEKKYIERGDIAVGFTPEMVYMAVGHASTVKHDDTSGSANTELWTYTNFYLPRNAAHFRTANYDPYSPYQPRRTTNGMYDFDNNQAGGAAGAVNYFPGGGSTVNTGGGLPTQGSYPLGMAPHGTDMTISATGGVQGSSGEPADLQAYTLYVLFVEGKVVKFGVKPN